MNKIKAFFTFFTFSWLLVCGFGALIPLLGSAATTEKVAWLGVIINALALPLWMLMRFLRPQKLAGDLRESTAFFAVLAGLALTLLADTQRGLPIYLVLFNLFAFLIYLYHLSAISHPHMPAVNEEFPELSDREGRQHKIGDFCAVNGLSGVFVIFLRGSYCADSRHQLVALQELRPEFERKKIGVLLWSAQPPSSWPADLLKPLSDSPVFSDEVSPLAGPAQFVARHGAPLLVSPWFADAVRPSAWLVDDEGTILWRALPGSYRTLPSAELLRSQCYRLLD
ncbi:redoxin domain-containing protein [Microbulbifer sp. HZ11]|uniref:redoxin domain-containing protein n=1 Tax=unclassified Microbulbifer TaxID=2619833 RepID=UPI0005B8ACFB|nr:redoxin domain-containing protein [Microbulbifer sp. HZ11]